MMGCVEHGESIWYAVVSVEILSDGSVESGVLSKWGTVQVWSGLGCDSEPPSRELVSESW